MWGYVGELDKEKMMADKKLCPCCLGKGKNLKGEKCSLCGGSGIWLTILGSSKTKPKTAEQINTPLTGKAESLSQKRRYDAVCSACKSQIERDMAKKIFDRIEPHITNALFQLHYDKDFESEMTWWQQLRQEYGI